MVDLLHFFHRFGYPAESDRKFWTEASVAHDTKKMSNAIFKTNPDQMFEPISNVDLKRASDPQHLTTFELLFGVLR